MGKMRKKRGVLHAVPVAWTDERPRPSAGSLGAAVKAEGSVAGRETRGLTTVRYESAVCSCGGENDNCFKCGGTGYYSAEIVEVTGSAKRTPFDSLRASTRGDARAETSFANDPRGGAYGIRELGRFESAPLRDDHDN